MIRVIDNFLNKITMYRLILYYLAGLLALAVIFCFLGLLPYNPVSLILSSFFVIVISWTVNKLFAVIFEVPSNLESTYITALILVLIIAPLQGLDFKNYIPLALWAAVWAIASKYILAIKKKHIFNPAALAVALTALTINQSANWWIGRATMMPFVILGGLLIVRKIRRFDLFWSFFVAAIATVFAFYFLKGQLNPPLIIRKVFADTPFFFLAFVMLTEPLTTPPTRMMRIIYGALVGFLFYPNIHIGSFYSTPELALLTGNILSYLASSKEKLVLKFEKATKAANDIYDFYFFRDKNFSFRPGQYLEWTLPQNHADSRGNRRFFTIASSPTEDKIMMGVKFYPQGSTFKRALADLKPGDKIVASQLAGEFVLPKDKSKKLVFLAGGIGVTPMRSMVKYLLDEDERRPIIMIYANKNFSDIAYKDIFDEARDRLGIKIVYALTDIQNIPDNWPGQKGRITEKTITEEIPDFKERIFYLSGPHEMVTAYKKTLTGMGISRSRIKTDYFPGFV